MDKEHFLNTYFDNARGGEHYKKILAEKGSFDSYIEGLDIIDDLYKFIVSAPQTSECWKVILGYTCYKDKLVDDGIYWFCYQVMPLFKQLIKPDSEEIKFRTENEIFLASILMMDDLLPKRIAKFLARTYVSGLKEISEKKYGIDSFFIYPPKAGRRKGSGLNEHYVIREFHRLMLEGKSKNEIYSQIAEVNFVSSDTVRRMVERWSKRSRKLP